MATKKKTNELAIVPTDITPKTDLVPVNSATLLAAGVADFRLTKDDIIELLVEEATASVEAELKTAKEEAHKAREGAIAANLAYSKTVSDARNAVASETIKPLKKIFPNAKLEVKTFRGSSDGLHSIIDIVVLGAELSREAQNELYFRGHSSMHQIEDKVYPILADIILRTAPPVDYKTPAIEAALAASAAAEKHEADLRQRAHEVAVRLREVKGSSKRLRTQLVRKVLAGNANGENILSNMKALSEQFIAQLTAGVPTHQC